MRDDAPSPAPRPSKPQLSRSTGSRTGQTGRPVRPGSSRSRAVQVPAVDAPPPEPVIAEAVLIAPPPPEPKPPKPPRPSFFGSRVLRQTLIPPCGVLGTGFLALGGAYFLQSPDAALRQMPASVPIILLAFGIVSIVCMLGLARSIGRIDSPAGNS